MLAALILVFIFGGRAHAAAAGSGVSSIAGRRHSGGGIRFRKELCAYRRASESVTRMIAS